MKRLRSLFGGTQSTDNCGAGDSPSRGQIDRNVDETTYPNWPSGSTGALNERRAEPKENGSVGRNELNLALPDPIYVPSEEIARRILDKAGELQHALESGALPTLPIAREIVARVEGVTEFWLRQGGSSTLHSTLIEPVLAMSNYLFAPIFLREPQSSRGLDAKASWDLHRALYRKYEFLKETGGRPQPGDEVAPLPASLIAGLEELAWQRVEPDAHLLERWIDTEPWFVQKIMFGGEAGHGVFYAYLCPWESTEVPEWAVEAGGVLLGETLVLSRRLDDLRGITASQVDSMAVQMAASAVPLVQSYVPIGEHQVRFLDPKLDSDSPEGQGFSGIAQSRLVFGVWGADQSPEACFAELARLNPDILKANVIPMGIGFSDDVKTGWAVVSGPAGSAAFGFEIEEGGSHNLICFGGPDVKPPLQVAMLVQGRTHGAFHAVLQGSRIVPFETLPGMALHVPAELAEELVSAGWEIGDDLYYLQHDGSVAILMVWNENHFGLFGWARETTRDVSPYQIQEVDGKPCLVLLLSRNDSLLESDRLTAAARELIDHL